MAVTRSGAGVDAPAEPMHSVLDGQLARPLFEQRCPWCAGKGRARRPCPLCGRLRGHEGGVESLWSESEARLLDGNR